MGTPHAIASAANGKRGGRPPQPQTPESLVYFAARIRRRQSDWIKHNGGAEKLRAILDEAMEETR